MCRGGIRARALCHGLGRRTQRSDEFGAARVTILGTLGERALKDRVELRRQLAASLRNRRHRLVDVRRSLGRRRLACKRPFAGEELERDDPERVAIACRRRPLAERLFRREVTGGSEHRSVSRQRREPRGARDAEVGDVQVAFTVDQEIPRLDVPVDDPVRVRVIERLPSLLEPPQRVRRRLAAVLLQPLLERGAVDVLHDDVGPLAGLADVVDRHDVRLVGDARRGACLAGEPPA